MLDVPVGPQNHIEGGTLTQGLPTHFLPWRQWGVFAVRVPADFGEDAGHEQCCWTNGYIERYLREPGQTVPWSRTVTVPMPM